MHYFSLKRVAFSAISLFIILIVFLSQNTHTRLPLSKELRPKISRQIIYDTKTYYSVTKVVDGDTIDIDVGGDVIRVRLIGLNTPETVDPRRTVACFGKEASDKAKSILTGQKIKIETDPSQTLYDKYGRLLAYVFLEDGTLFNRTMIEEGYGYEYTYHVPYKYQDKFKTAQTKAQTEKKGLWADGVCQ